MSNSNLRRRRRFLLLFLLLQRHLDDVSESGLLQSSSLSNHQSFQLRIAYTKISSKKVDKRVHNTITKRINSLQSCPCPLRYGSPCSVCCSFIVVQNCKICVTHEMCRLKGQPTARVFDVIKTGPTKTPDSLQPL
jgi:hypothetical protein